MKLHVFRPLRAARLLVVLSLFAVLPGCSIEGAVPSALNRPDASMGRAAGGAPPGRLLAYTAELSLEVSEIEPLAEPLQRIVSANDGYLLQSSSRGESLSATIKVPPEKLTLTMDALAALGQVQSKSVHAEDVTDTVQDLDSQLATFVALRERYRRVLERANEVKDLLAVEQELNRIEQEIQRIETARAGVGKRVSFATLSFSAQEKRIYGPVGFVLHSTVWVVEKLFFIR